MWVSMTAKRAEKRGKKGGKSGKVKKRKKRPKAKKGKKRKKAGRARKAGKNTKRAGKKRRKRLSPALRRLVEHGFDKEFKEEKIDDIERLSVLLMRKFKISAGDVERRMEKEERKGHSPMQLIEIERKIKKELLYVPIDSLPGVPYFERKRERALDLVVEARRHSR